MTDWTEGYVADIGYTFGYYADLNPIRTKFAFASSGLVFPEVVAACELGYGQGVSVNMHAAASATSWFGTDFNPTQAGFAQELARAAGSNAQLFDQSFAEFCGRAELPEFDYIGLHGIWSWISDQNRSVIVDFIRRKLKVGGVLYISYNTQPGWAAFAPMRHLMAEHAGTLGAEGHGIVNRIDNAIEFADKLFATNPLFARANPQVAGRLEKLKKHNRQYLAHEYFNQDWRPMHFAEMARWLEPAKLTYACSANYLDYVDSINLTTDQQKLLNDITDPVFRQSVRDFVVNQQFRREYWVRGARTLGFFDRIRLLRAQRVILTTYRPNITLKINGSLGEAKLVEAIYSPLIDFLSDYQPKSLAEIEGALQNKGIDLSQITQAIGLLSGAGHLSAVQDESTIAHARKRTDRLNAHIIGKAKGSHDVACLAKSGHRWRRGGWAFSAALSGGGEPGLGTAC